MKAASSPMAAIEAQHLNVGYVAIAKSLGLPTQAYMALSDGKFLDAQAGAETMTSALLAALAGVNSVSGPGMLDFVLTFSLPKLVFDNEVCGQCLHFVRELRVVEDLPATDLVSHLRENDHLITSPHTLKHWPQRAVPDGSGLRPRQPRDLDRDGFERAGPARLRGSGPAARVLHADPDGRRPGPGDAPARHLGPETANRTARVAAATRAGRRPVRSRPARHRQAAARAGCRGARRRLTSGKNGTF